MPLSDPSLVVERLASIDGKLDRLGDSIETVRREGQTHWENHSANLARLEADLKMEIADRKEAIKQEKDEREKTNEKEQKDRQKDIGALRSTLSKLAFALVTFFLGLVAAVVVNGVIH